MKDILETITHVGILEQYSTNIRLSWFMMVLCVNSEWCEKKSCWWRVEKIWCMCKMMFLTPPRQGTNPQILKLEFPMQTWGTKQKLSKINW